VILVINDNEMMEKIKKNKERGRRLGIFAPNEEPDTEAILDVDLIWHILAISNELDSCSSEEIKHKKMLQYANLNKVRAVNRQTRDRKDLNKKAEGMFEKIVRENLEKQKAEEKRLKEKKTEITKKVISGKTLNEDEQDLLDVEVEMEMMKETG